MRCIENRQCHWNCEEKCKSASAKSVWDHFIFYFIRISVSDQFSLPCVQIQFPSCSIVSNEHSEELNAMLTFCLVCEAFCSSHRLVLFCSRQSDRWSMATDENVNIDAIVEQLLEVRKHPKLEKIELKENDIRLIVQKAREIFLSQPVLLELGKPFAWSFFLPLWFLLRCRGTIKNLRWHSRSICRFTSIIRCQRLSTWCQLSFSR